MNTTNTPKDEPEGANPRSSRSTGSVFDLEGCPHCGGKSGFTYKLRIRGVQFHPWKGGDSDAYFEDEGIADHGAYRCDDCGRIIRPNTEVRHRR